MKKSLYILFLTFCISASVFPQIPKLISYHGILTDTMGKPKLDGEYNFTFRFYESYTGGKALWSESKKLKVKEGLYSTNLGNETPFGSNLNFDKPYWLSIQIGTEPELSPRIALTSFLDSAGIQHATQAIILPPDVGRATTGNPNGKLIFKLGSGEDSSTFEFAEGYTNPNGGPPVHVHMDMDEAFYVLSGSYRFKVGNQVQEAGPGWFVFIPHGVPHAFVNSGTTIATHVEIHSHPGLEKYFKEISEAVKKMPPGPPDQKILNAISDRYKVRIVGPPLGNVQLLELPRNKSSQSKDKVDLQKVIIDGDIELHYIVKGEGEPVLFIPGSLNAYSVWNKQVEDFSKSYKAISYSRRYDFPNHNVIKPGYSAITDAEDAAALIKKLNLGKVNVVAHSYGALGALFLAYQHPELIKSLVLAEPPAISLLNHLSDNNSPKGKMLFQDIQDNMVSPMKDAIISGHEEDANRIFFNYVLRDSSGYQKFIPPHAKADMMANIAEWDAIFKMGEFFPEITPSQIRHIKTPVLLLLGSKTIQFLPYISERLHELLPNNKLIVLKGASHIMWREQPEECRRAAIEFFRDNP